MASETPHGIGELDDATKAEVDAILQRVDPKALMGYVKRVASLRTSTREDIAPAVKLAEGPERFEAQYTRALEALTAFGVDHKDAPTWEAVHAKITPEVLRAAERMKEPKLVLTPPLTRHQLVAAVDARKGKFGVKSDTYTYSLDDDNLYNNGKPEANLAWEVHVVEGMQDVAVNKAVQYSNDRPLYNHQQVRGLLAHYKALGLDVLNGARSYLALMMQGLVAKKPTDKDFWTVLNADVVANDEKNESLVGGGRWGVVQVSLDHDSPSAQNYDLRVRAAVRVNL